MTVLVTNMGGKPLQEIWVKASGPIDREGSTDASGTVVFNNVNPGTYRLRFEHDDYITFEREVTVAAGRPLRTTASLNAAPPPKPAPTVEAPPPPAPKPTAPPIGSFEPMVVPVEAWIESNFVGRNPSKRLAAGCSGSTVSTLVQTNEPVAEHAHPDAEETIYIVVGEGTLKIGGRDYSIAASSFATIPRGISHSMSRRGSRPLMFVSTLSGPPCQQAKQ